MFSKRLKILSPITFSSLSVLTVNIFSINSVLRNAEKSAKAVLYFSFQALTELSEMTAVLMSEVLIFA
jgi:hypothetical protein